MLLSDESNHNPFNLALSVKLSSHNPHEIFSQVSTHTHLCFSWSFWPELHTISVVTVIIWVFQRKQCLIHVYFWYPAQCLTHKAFFILHCNFLIRSLFTPKLDCKLPGSKDYVLLVIKSLICVIMPDMSYVIINTFWIYYIYY